MKTLQMSESEFFQMIEWNVNIENTELILQQ
jgi:hypothetical protein